MKIEVNRLHHPVTALGPGVRAGIWLQGCTIGCKGCLSRDTWPRREEAALEVGTVVEWIAQLGDGRLDGVTISGGEPFDQPAALGELLAALAFWRDGLGHEADILCYSGYSLRRLRRVAGEALGNLDAVITGPYVRERPTDLVWRGSANQALVPLTPLGEVRYGPYLGLRPERTPLQVSVDRDAVRCVGVPRAGDMARLERRLERTGIDLGWTSWQA